MKKKISNLPPETQVFTAVKGPEAAVLDREYAAIFLSSQGYGDCPATRTKSGWYLVISPEEAQELQGSSLGDSKPAPRPDPDAALLAWAKKRLARESRPENIDALEGVIGMLTATAAPSPEVVNAFEMGFRCCEKGMNLDAALATLRKLFV